MIGWPDRLVEGTVAADPAHLSDAILVGLIAHSDQAALNELYRRFGRPAYRLAARIIRDDVLAEEAVQDAFLDVWRLAEQYECERAKPSTWILTFVHRRAVDLVRRECRQRTEPLEVAEAPPCNGADDEAVVRARRADVQDALRRLPDDQRRILELAYYGGLTQSELAERLHQPLGTVKSRTFSGLARLRQLLAEADERTELPSRSNHR
jgi:RNA polymerase sigma factor (sigma-70 family)